MAWSQAGPNGSRVWVGKNCDTDEMASLLENRLTKSGSCLTDPPMTCTFFKHCDTLTEKCADETLIRIKTVMVRGRYCVRERPAH